MTGEVRLGPARLSDEERAAMRVEAAEETVQAAASFPSYEVPAFVAERFPEFRPEDPSTWPDADRCTDGRPWGFDAYAPSGVLGRDLSDRWRRYLAAVDAGPSQTRRRTWVDRDRGCRNRWKHTDSRLCGTHDRPWRDMIESARRSAARNARLLEYVDLAKQLGAHGIEGDAGANGVLLRRDAIEGLLRLLGDPPFPSTDTTVPPPL